MRFTPSMTLLSRPLPRPLFVLAAALLLGLLGASLLHDAWWNTLSMDEGIHLPAGVTYLTLADPRMNPEHPPLIKLLAGAGAMAAGARIPPGWPAWQGNNEEQLRVEFQQAFPRPRLQRIVFSARLPMVALTLLLGLVVLLYGRRLGGEWGGLLALAWFVSNPLILAFGGSVLNDVAITLAALVTCQAIVRLWRRPDAASVLLYAAALDLALIAKFSGLLLIPFSVLAWAVLLWHTGQARRMLRLATAAASGFLLAGLFVWGIYFITFRHADIHLFAQSYFEEEVPQPGTPAFQASRRRVQLFARLEQHPAATRVLMPAFYYLAGVRFVTRAAQRPVYLLGRRLSSGVWYYFPLLTALKSSPGFLAGLLLAAALAVIPLRSQRLAPEALVLALWWVVYTTVALCMKLNLGLRHYMPGIVALMVLTALAVPALQVLASRVRPRVARWMGWALACSAVAALWTAAAQWPWYLPYYNDLRMHTPDGWIASDSNIDSGMSLRAVDDFAARARVDEVAVVPFQPHVFALSHLIAHGVPWNCAAPSLPSGRWLAVSTHRFYDPRHPGDCDYLLAYPHQPLAGGSMEIFDLGALHPGTTNAQRSPDAKGAQ